jgi:chromosome segregation ATPase
LNNSKTKQPSLKQSKEHLMGTPTAKKDRYEKLDESIHRDNQGYVDNQLVLQNRIVQQQEVGLEQASHGIQRVQQIAIEMGNEIDDQNKELEEMERDVEKTQGMLKRTMGRLNKLLNNGSDRGKVILIIILVILIIGLVALVLAI